MLTNDQLHALGIVEGRKAKIEFVSGVDVSGKVESILRRDGKLLLITFSNCTAKYGDRVLFNPDWGMYDMAVGERISSVFNGAADKDAYNQVALVPKERTIKVPSDAKRKRLENLYAQVRKIRESKAGYERLGEIWETQQAEHPEDWLLSMEIFEILDATDQQRELKTKIEKFLNEKKAKTKDLSTLISWGFRLVDYHKKPEYQARSKRRRNSYRLVFLPSPALRVRLSLARESDRGEGRVTAASFVVIASEVEESLIVCSCFRRSQ